MNLLILISTLAFVQSRPQKLNPNVGTSSIEFQKHQFMEIQPASIATRNPKELDATTEDILKKIEAINHKYGYKPKSPIIKTNVTIPHFYDHSYDMPFPLRLENFLKRGHSPSSPSRHSREISNKYYLAIPNNYGFSLYSLSREQRQNGFDRKDDEKTSENSLNLLENQMLSNVKGIILKSQLPPYIQELSNFNPLVQNLPFVNSFTPYKKTETYETSGYINNIPNMPFNEYKVDGYQPDRDIPKVPKPNENGNTGIFNYLRILLDMERNSLNASKRTGKQFNINQFNQNPNYKPKFIIESINKGIQVAEYNDRSPTHNLPIPRSIQNNKINKIEEVIPLESQENQSEDNDDPVESREEKALEKHRKKTKNDQIQDDSDNKHLNPIQFILQHNKNKQTTTTTPSYDDDETNKDIINENNKKLLSKDNTGSGIFIHRLKVKKGGVAIAGPGGIATAGSGGTAIVGPNGYAYTHPDSLAIAGSGSKVIAVDPSVSLSDIINGNQRGRRVGKVVAIGPVIYYNKGLLKPDDHYQWHLQPLTNFAFGYPENHYQIHPLQPNTHKLTNKQTSPDIKTSLEANENSKFVVENVVDEINVADVLKEKTKQLEKLIEAEEILRKLNAKSAPYRSHPLFHYLKNKNTIEEDKVISFRNEENANDTITLILKPVARAIAGQEGRAIANPVSRAILRQGTNVDILFEPEAVAIAGPGGIAHAESDLEINYEDI